MWYNSNWHSPSNARTPISSSPPSRQKSTIRRHEPEPHFDRSTVRITSPAFTPDANKSRVSARIRFGKLPGPESYKPKVLHTGKEWDFADLNGAELMKSANFYGGSPARSRPQDWGSLAENAVAHHDSDGVNHAPWPGPFSYRPCQQSVIPRATLKDKISTVGREATIVGSTSAKDFPGPGYFDPQLLPSGKEFDFADLNGAELMISSAFANRNAQRASPQQWARTALLLGAPGKPLLNAPREYTWLGPGSHDPMYDSLDAIAGVTAHSRRGMKKTQAANALRQRPEASRNALEVLQRSSGGRCGGSTELSRTVTAPARLEIGSGS